MSRSRILVVFTALLALVVAACGGGAATAVPTATRPAAAPTVGTTQPGATATPAAIATRAPTPTVAPKKGGTVRYVNQSNGNRVDPHASLGATATADPWNLVASTLVRLKPIDHTLYGDLADSWQYKSPTELTINIKKGVHFQQESLAKGREVTSADVVASLNRARITTAPFAYGRAFSTVSDVAAVDPYTVKVTFSKHDANFLFYASMIGGSILPKEAIDKYPTSAIGEDAWYGSGPFVIDLTSYRADVSGAANRNAKFDIRPGEPYLDRVEYVGIADASSRTAALRSGQVDVGLVPVTEKDLFVKQGYTIFSTEDMLVTAQHTSMNTQVFPTNDWRVRKAIHLAIDREELKGIVADNFGCTVIILGCKSTWFLSEKEWAGKPGFRADKKVDIAEAKDLLKQAGIDPAKITLVHYSSTQNPYKVHLEQAIAITGMLQRNLNIKIDHQTPGTGYDSTDRTKKDGFHLLNRAHGGLGGYILDWGLPEFLTSTGTLNNSLWFDAKTDAMFEAEKATQDPVARRKIFADVQRYLMEDQNLPVAPTVRNYDYFGTTPRVHGWDGTGVYYLGIYAWQFSWTWVDK